MYASITFLMPLMLPNVTHEPITQGGLVVVLDMSLAVLSVVANLVVITSIRYIWYIWFIRYIHHVQ